MKRQVRALWFVGLKPVYVRQVLEGLEMAANNRRKFEWGGVLELIAAALARHDEPIDPATLFDGDDRDWNWANVKAAELLAAGLRQGAQGVAFEHADRLRSIVETLNRMAPDRPKSMISKSDTIASHSSLRRRRCVVWPSN